MKSKAFLAVVSAFLFSVSAFADIGASRGKVESLHDLPTRWEGIAGDLFSRVPAVLNIDRVVKVTSRETTSSGFEVTYEVEASFVFGDRALPVKTVRLHSYTYSRTISELTLALTTGDQLTPILFGTVVYDEATDSFSFKEYPREGGARRWALTGRVRR